MPRTSITARSRAGRTALVSAGVVARFVAASTAKSTRHVVASSLLAAGALATTACGTPAARPGVAGLAQAPAAERTRSGSQTITANDFGRASDAPNALVAIERLRPLFLRPRPSFGSLRGSAPVISVFVNGAYAGGPDALRVIGADAVASARFLQPTEAITTLGTRYAADGVIMVQLKGFRR